MSGITLVQTYNQIFAQNYKHFCIFAQNDADLVNNVYLKIYNNFQVANFTGKTLSEIKEKIYGYCKVSIYNTFLTQKRLQKNNIEIENCQTQLQQTESIDEDNRTETQQLEFISMKLFQYLKLHYSEADEYVFTCYYLYDKDKRLTYAQLSTITGFSISKVCGIIKRIKQDLQQNLVNYINND